MDVVQNGFTDPDNYPIDARGLSYTYAFIGVKRLGSGQFYLISIRDKDGNLLEGGKSYRLTVPPDAPIGEAQTLKSLEASFRRCGVPLIAVLTPGNEPTVVPVVELNLDNDNREPQLLPLLTCLAHFKTLEHPDTLAIRILPQMQKTPTAAPDVLTFETRVPSIRQDLPAYSLIATFGEGGPSLGPLRFSPVLPLRFKIDETTSTAASAFLGRETSLPSPGD